MSAARSAGADGCELDLRLSADGVLVGAHDDSLARVAGRNLRVSSTPVATLRALTLPGGGRIALLPELVEAADAGRTVLELKRPLDAPGAVARTVSALAGELRRLPGEPDLTVSSFDPRLVAGVRALRLPVRTALLGKPLVQPRALLARAVLDGHDEMHPHVGALCADPDAVGLARAHGLDVVAWTVNAPSDARLLAGVDTAGVISDDPGRLRAALEPVPALPAG